MFLVRSYFLATLGLGLMMAMPSNAKACDQVLPVDSVFTRGWTLEEANEMYHRAVDQDSIPLMERAIKAYRASEGPYTLAQLPASERVLQHWFSSGHWLPLENGLDRIMDIYSVHYDENDPVYVGIWRARAYWHMLGYFNRPVEHESLGPLSELISAYSLTVDAIQLASSVYEGVHPDLPDMLRDLAAMAWLYSKHHEAGDTVRGRVRVRHSGSHRIRARDPVKDLDGYRQGRQALEGVVSLYEKPVVEDVGALRQAYLDLAQWHREFGYHQRAERARDLARKAAEEVETEQRRSLHETEGGVFPVAWLSAWHQPAGSLPRLAFSRD